MNYSLINILLENINEGKSIEIINKLIDALTDSCFYHKITINCLISIELFASNVFSIAYLSQHLLD